MDEITDSLGRALGRIEDFRAVQAGAGGDELYQAALLLQQSVGIGDPARALVHDHLEAHGGVDRVAGPFLLGVIVGLIAAEFRDEREEAIA